MTFLATVRAGYVINRLPGGHRVVVATHATAVHSRMIDSNRRCPGRWGMATLTTRCAIDVPGRFSGSRRPVVTAGALAGDAGMVECGRGPAAGRMALVAIIGAGDVVRGFSGGRCPVMTTDAGAENG